MEKQAHQFIEIRNTLLASIGSSFQVFFSQLWDPLSSFFLVKETKKLLKDELREKYSDFPKHLLPQFNISLREVGDLEVAVQEFMNDIKGLQYMGTCDMGGNIYDLYVRGRYGAGPPVFYTRYGHDHGSFMTGSYEAEADFVMGQMTPLAVAYQMALDKGYIEDKNFQKNE